jgi:hypothetical protein
MAVAHESFLVFRDSRYLKRAVWLVLLSIAAYVAWVPPTGHNGGTWLGYTLGTIAALLIIWLMLLGIRKRRYGPGHWSLGAWLSAHVYLGLSLLVLATLHAGFQVGWNIHTLAYVLMIIVILSGVWGVIAYARLPRLITENRLGQSFEGIGVEIIELDQQCAELASDLGDAFAAEVRRSRDESKIGGSLRRQLGGRDPNCGTTKAVATVRELAAKVPAEQRGAAQSLLEALGRKQELLRRARLDVRYKALLDIWLVLHVPLSFALLAALIAHIVSVFFYWG